MRAWRTRARNGRATTRLHTVRQARFEALSEEEQERRQQMAEEEVGAGFLRDLGVGSVRELAILGDAWHASAIAGGLKRSRFY